MFMVVIHPRKLLNLLTSQPHRLFSFKTISSLTFHSPPSPSPLLAPYPMTDQDLPDPVWP